MSKAPKKKPAKRSRSDEQQLAARRRRDELRRSIARETEIARLTRVLMNARARADESLASLRDWLNEQSETTLPTHAVDVPASTAADSGR